MGAIRKRGDAIILPEATRDVASGQCERWLRGSPSYLGEYGAPRNPADLAYHACICIRNNDEDLTLQAALANPSLHRLLALLDALRIGRARERGLAAKLLAAGLMHARSEALDASR